MILDGVGSRYIHAIVVATCPRPLVGTATFAIRQVTLKQSTGEEMEKLERRDNPGAPIAAMLKTTLVSWRHKAIAFLPTAFLSSTQGSIEKSFARSSCIWSPTMRRKRKVQTDGKIAKQTSTET